MKSLCGHHTSLIYRNWRQSMASISNTELYIQVIDLEHRLS